MTPRRMVPSTQTLIRTDKLGRAKCEHCGVMLDVSDFHVFEEIECPDCEKTTTVPGKLGGYTLIRELGRGGMGSVFLARDEHLERKVALKVLNIKYGQDPVFVDSLLREAKAAAALNHPNIVHIYTFGQVYEQPYFVMELVDGLRLDECINPEIPQEEEGWLGMMEQVTRGLIAAEEKGLIHGDIKPANILLNERGVAKLSDFGIARFDGDASDRILGTPLYIAPEKSRGKSVDSRADQFSLGASFWHILTGTPPYTGADARSVVLNRFEHPPLDPREKAPHLSQATAKMLMRTMAIDPNDRFASFKDLHKRIGKILSLLEDQRAEIEAAEAAIRAEQDALDTAKAEDERLAQEKKQRQRLVMISAGAILVSILLVLVVLVVK